MNNYDNIETFINNEADMEQIDLELGKLLLFASCSKFEREFCSRNPFFSIFFRVGNKKNKYFFNYKGKRYNFNVFGDEIVQKCDKKILKNAELRKKKRLLRTLKLACSLDLLEPKIVVGKSMLGKLELLILYQENGVEMVIDYGANLVMKKSDYYELFKFAEFNVVDKMELYNIAYLIDAIGNYEDIYEYLLFSKEVITDMGKNFAWLVDKYDKSGINLHNYLLFGNDCDCLFFQEMDFFGTKYEKLKDDLDRFTLNPNNKEKGIKYNSNNKIYKLLDKKFGYFTFKLLSDMFGSAEVKEELLSSGRYRKCHSNAIRVANSLQKEDMQYAYVVGGKCKYNEIDYYLHTWVEFDKGKDSIVIDFNHNLVMNKKKYYKLYEAQVISKTNIYEMNDMIELLVDEVGINLHSLDLVYFGREMMESVKKSKVLKREE